MARFFSHSIIATAHATISHHMCLNLNSNIIEKDHWIKKGKSKKFEDHFWQIERRKYKESFLSPPLGTKTLIYDNKDENH